MAYEEELGDQYLTRLAEFFTQKEYSEYIELRKIWKDVYQANRHIDFTTAARRANEAVIRYCFDKKYNSIKIIKQIN
jgi:hypothetical protein